MKFKKGYIPWNKGLYGEEYRTHYKMGIIKGGRKKGYKHTLKSRIKMSINMVGKKKKVNHTKKELKRRSNMMKKNRQNLEFNKKMWESFKRSVTKPHKKVLDYIKENVKLKTITNYGIMVGNKSASIDEADTKNKVAFFIDGNYWHNYPNLRKWDKIVNTYLRNRGWKVYRFWESDIKDNFQEIKGTIKKIESDLKN